MRKMIMSLVMVAGMILSLLFSLCACEREKQDSASFQCTAFQASYINLPEYENTNISVRYSTSTQEHIIFLQYCMDVTSEMKETRFELVWTDWTGRIISTQTIDRSDGFVPICLAGSSDLIYAIGQTEAGTTLAVEYGVSGPTESLIDFGIIPQFEHAVFVDGVFAFRYSGGSIELFRDEKSVYQRQDYQNEIHVQRLMTGDKKIAYVGMNQEHSAELVVIDPVKLKAKVTPVSLDPTLIEQYNSSVGLVYKDWYELVRLNIENGKMEVFMSLQDSDIPPSDYIYTVSLAPFILDDNHVVYINNPTTSFTACDPVEIILMTRLEQNPQEGKTILTLGGNAVTMDPSIQYAVYIFNTEHNEYRIHLRDYSKEYPYASLDEYTRTLAQLIGDMSSGKGDDLLYGASLFDLPKLGRNGMLVDMMPYLEADPTMSADDWLPSIFDLMQTNGMLYRFFPGFWLEGNFGKKDFFPDPNNASVVELMRIAEYLPLGVSVFPESLSVDMIAAPILYDLDGFIDDTGTFRISEEEMQTLIDYALKFGGLTENIPSDEEILKNFLCGNTLLYFSGLESAITYGELEKTTGEEIVFTGFPTVNGTARLCIPSAPIAISDGTEHPEICWEFVKVLMRPEVQQRITEMALFPVSRKAFDDYMDKAIHPELRSAAEQAAFSYTEKIAVSEESVSRLREIIDSLNVTNEFDFVLYDIISQECLPAVHGQKSAAEIAEILSDRINIYLKSQ